MALSNKHLNMIEYQCLQPLIVLVKRTVGVISSDPPCKDGNARFTTVPLKALSDQMGIRTSCFSF